MRKLVLVLLFAITGLGLTQAQEVTDPFLNPDAYIVTIRVTADDTRFTVPVDSYIIYNYTVHWKPKGSVAIRGTKDGQTADCVVNFGAAGDHSLAISGEFPRIKSFGSRLISVDQWGTAQWTSMNTAFNGCVNLISLPEQAPDLSGCTNLRFMFSDASKFNQGLNNWDVSEVSNMMGMFNGASQFNGDISGWDVGKLRTVSHFSTSNNNGMFMGAAKFIQDISGWEIQGITNMCGMFKDAISFNQDISGWNVSDVTNISSLFEGAISFNQDLSGWDLSSCTNFRNSVLSIDTYSSYLIKMAAKNDIPNGLRIDASGLEYNKRATPARGKLIDDHNWSFNDDRLESFHQAMYFPASTPEIDVSTGLKTLGISFTCGDLITKSPGAGDITVLENTRYDPYNSRSGADIVARIGVSSDDVSISEDIVTITLPPDLTLKNDTFYSIRIDGGSFIGYPGTDGLALRWSFRTGPDMTAARTSGPPVVTEPEGVVVTVSDGYTPCIYPNPVTDWLTIKWEPYDRIQVYTTGGELVLESEDNKIDLSAYADGVYIVHIEGSIGSVGAGVFGRTFRIIKQ